MRETAKDLAWKGIASSTPAKLFLHLSTFYAMLKLPRNSNMEISPNKSAETSLSHSCVLAFLLETTGGRIAGR